MANEIQNAHRDELYAIVRDTYDRILPINTALDKIIALGAKSDLKEERSEQVKEVQETKKELSENEPRMGTASASENDTASPETDEDDEVATKRPISRRSTNKKTNTTEN